MIIALFRLDERNVVFEIMGKAEVDTEISKREGRKTDKMFLIIYCKIQQIKVEN